MKHANDLALDALEGLLTQLRQQITLKEKKRGVFYYQNRAFLHFHEDAAGLFADLRTTDDFRRYPITTLAEQDALLTQLKTYLISGLDE